MKNKYWIGIVGLFIVVILCMPVMGVSASPVKENQPKTSFIKYNPPKPSFIKFNQPPYKHPQPPVQGKRMGMPNPNADTEQYEQLMEKYKSPEWEARKAAEGTITEQPGNLITYAYLPKQLIPFHPVYIIGSNPIWCYR